MQDGVEKETIQNILAGRITKDFRLFTSAELEELRREQFAYATVLKAQNEIFIVSKIRVALIFLRRLWPLAKGKTGVR